MDDALLVGRAISGDLESFGQLFDQYYPRVYDFAWRTLGDPVAATEATRDIFLQAARRLPHGTAGIGFPAWLFSLAFNTVVPRAVTGRAPETGGAALHEEAFGSFEVPDPARVTDPALIGNDHELAVLVWEALTSLTPRDRAILDLHVRQGLDSAAMAPVLSLNKRDAANLVTRMKAAASDVVLSYVIARRGGTACERLQDVLAPFSIPPYTDASRRAVDAHVKDCAVCGGARSRLIPPLDVYGALAPGQSPVESKGDVWAAIAAGWSARRDPIAELSLASASVGQGGGVGLSLGGGGIGGGGGSFVAGTGGWDRRQVLWFAAAAAALIVFAFVVGFVATTALGGDSGNTPAVDASTRTAVATDTPGAAALITPGVAVLTATPNLTPSITPAVTDTPTPLAATETPVPVTATATSKPVATPTKTPGGPTPTKTPTATKTVKAASPTPAPTLHITPTPKASPIP
jgi:DNA-directed RNA polymerase specialized sigma24 family protein